MNDIQTQAIIRRLRLKKHPEGGYYRETYRSREKTAASALPERYGRARACSTAIYYLLRAGEFSAFHRLKSDEIFHFYGGSALTLFLISAAGRSRRIRLGMDLAKGERPQAVIARGTWFAAAVLPGSRTDFALAGCTVAPGFDFADFEMADRAALLKKYPSRRAWILKWTRARAPQP